MRNMLAFLAAVTLTVIAVGWYFDWFRLTSVPGSGGHRSVTIDINTPKIKHDVSEAEHKIEKKLADKSQSGDAPATPAADPAKPLVGKALRTLGNVLDQPNP